MTDLLPHLRTCILDLLRANYYRLVDDSTLHYVPFIDGAPNQPTLLTVNILEPIKATIQGSACSAGYVSLYITMLELSFSNGEMAPICPTPEHSPWMRLTAGAISPPPMSLTDPERHALGAQLSMLTSDERSNWGNEAYNAVLQQASQNDPGLPILRPVNSQAERELDHTEETLERQQERDVIEKYGRPLRQIELDDDYEQ